MIRSGLRIIKDDPLTGVGPDMVIQVYPHYRDPGAVKQSQPHLHDVPLQIAAERGLPALAAWLWFIVVLLRDFWRKSRSSALRSLPTAALAGVVAMLAAGMFEYNFGDSEFLMLFLLLVTLPYAADRAPATAPARPPSVASRLTMSTFDALLGRIAGRSILVVGDLMLDHFVYGRVTRISPEAPVPVVQFEREEFRLGGAANVASNIVALGGRAQAVGVVGADSEAARLLAELQALGVDTTGIVSDSARCTTRKLRVVTTRNQQVARIDYESDAEIDGARRGTRSSQASSNMRVRPTPCSSPTT